MATTYTPRNTPAPCATGAGPTTYRDQARATYRAAYALVLEAYARAPGTYPTRLIHASARRYARVVIRRLGCMG